MNKPDYSTIRDLRFLMKSETRSQADVARRFRQRARDLNEATKAFITIAPEGDGSSSEPKMTRLEAHPLAGIPYSCKDVFKTNGVLTTAGSRLLADFLPDQDAAVVEKLKHAGAALVGKTNMHEFCYGITGVNPTYGTPVNPFARNRIAGGSSSGSAVSVATGSSVFSIGSDTGGSVRVPAALCGLVGMKPTYELVTTKGMIPFCWTLDHAGIITRSCLDAAPVLELLAGWYDGTGNSDVSPLEERLVGRATSVLRGLRIGIPRQYFFERVDGEISQALEQLLTQCRELGAVPVEIETPDLTHVRTASLAIQLVEALSWHGPRMEAGAPLYGDDVRRGLVQGQLILGEHYVQSLRLMEKKRREFNTLFQFVDIILTPTTPIIAPELSSSTVRIDGEDELVGNALTRFTCIFNLTGNPALTLPCGRHSTGLPIGVQIVGKPYEDAKVLEIGHALEVAGIVGWAAPPLPA